MSWFWSSTSSTSSTSSLTEFRTRYSLEDRIQTFKNLKAKYPERIPIIVNIDPKLKVNGNNPRKYLIDPTWTLSQLLINLRESIMLKSNQALFLFINNTMIPPNQLLTQVYDKYKDIDGFLYINCMPENTFGC